MNLELLNRPEKAQNPGLFGGAKIDPKLDRREQLDRYKSGAVKYTFSDLICEIRSGELDADDVEEVLGYVVRDSAHRSRVEVSKLALDHFNGSKSSLGRAKPSTLVKLRFVMTMPV